MSYKVKLQTFEGPFDLLVYLIENAQMSIYDIEIKSITGQYLEYIKAMQEMDIAVATEFMVLASSLIEIKYCRSRRKLRKVYLKSPEKIFPSIWTSPTSISASILNSSPRLSHLS